MPETTPVLLLDLGNTQLKAGLGIGGDVVVWRMFPYTEGIQPITEVLKAWYGSYGTPVEAYWCSVSDKNHWLESLAEGIKCTRASVGRSLPIGIDYLTPETLGIDRVLSVLGALSGTGQGPILVLNLGTCITADYLDSAGNYRGGAISPGWHMRLMAMHEFTANLPLVEAYSTPLQTGRSTKECMQSGAFWGVVAELKHHIEYYQQAAGTTPLHVWLAGGDAPIFESHLQPPIFADPILVLRGLNQLFLHDNN
jgi:type III pantothenate kinase